MHPHLDALDTEEDDESDDQRDFGAISEHLVNFIESMSETDELSDEETPRAFIINHCNQQQKMRKRLDGAVDLDHLSSDFVHRKRKITNKHARSNRWFLNELSNKK